MHKSNPISDSNGYIITAITIGGALEWYEIGIFFSWPFLIERQVAGLDISLAESLNSGLFLIMILLTLANGATRAIGGWFFGKKGDKEGRKVAFPLTLLVSTLPSWSLAILSFFISYENWLTYSTLLFTIVKFFQGMPAGGELPGSICYLSEAATSVKSRRYMCSYSLLGPQVGISLSVLVCLALKAILPTEYLVEYAWRYVFILSGCIGICGYIMRKKIHETAVYSELKSHHKVKHKPIKILFSNHLSKVILAFSLSIFEVVSFAVISFIPYLFSKDPFNLNGNRVMALVVIFSFLKMVLLPLFGTLYSRFVSIPWLKTSVFGVLIFTPILYLSYINELLVSSILSTTVLIIFMSIQASILPSILAEIFPVPIRYSGIAFSFNICDGILWSGFVGVCFVFMKNNNPEFIFILIFAALTFLLSISSNLYKKHQNFLK